MDQYLDYNVSTISLLIPSMIVLLVHYRIMDPTRTFVPLLILILIIILILILILIMILILI